MAWGVRSVQAWATAALEAVLRDRRPGLVTPGSPAAGDPLRPTCTLEHPGHHTQYLQVIRAAELRDRGDAVPVRYADHDLLAAGDLTWADDAAPGSDRGRAVLRLDLRRDDGTPTSLITHDTRGLATIEACDGVGLWWVPDLAILFVPSWRDTAIPSADRAATPSSWPTYSVAEASAPWRPCPVAPPRNARSI